MRVAHIVSQHFVDGRLEDILLKRKQPILGNPSLIHICGVMQFCSASPCDEHFELCRYHSSSMWQAVQVWKDGPKPRTNLNWPGSEYQRLSPLPDAESLSPHSWI